MPAKEVHTIHALDPHSLLALAFNSKGGTNSNASFESSTRKSRHDSPEAALVVKSFWYKVPEVLTGGKISANPMIPSTIPLWTSFEGEGYMDHGFRYKLQTRLDNVVDTIRQEAAINISMEGQSLAQMCIQDAKTFTSASPQGPEGRSQIGGEKLSDHAALEFTQGGFSNHPVVQTILNEHIRHQAVMQNEMNTHLEALKKEQ
eukprot:jgi/Psemu1/1376/gm1.1376_g